MSDPRPSPVEGAALGRGEDDSDGWRFSVRMETALAMGQRDSFLVETTCDECGKTGMVPGPALEGIFAAGCDLVCAGCGPGATAEQTPNRGESP